MRQGESHIRVGASMARPPWPILIVIALFVIFPLVQLWPEISALSPPGSAGDDLGFDSFRLEHPILHLTLRLVAGWLIAAAFGHGLWRGSRFVHVLALLWLLVGKIAFGAITVSDYGWEYVRNFSQVGLFYGAVPIAFGIVAILFLVLPVSWRWTSQHHRLLRH